MRLIARSVHFHMKCYSTFLHVMPLRKLEMKQESFVVWLFTVRSEGVSVGGGMSEDVDRGLS